MLRIMAICPQIKKNEWKINFMSIIRQYGHVILNLTKILSVRVTSRQTLEFTLPLSNQFYGNIVWMSDEKLKVQVYDAYEELASIRNTLETYLNSKKDMP